MLHSCIPIGQVHHLRGPLFKIFVGYQITILCKFDSPTTKTGRSYVANEADVINILPKID